MHYALCQMPMPKEDADDVLYEEGDGRELDARAESFARSCFRSIREAGYLKDFMGASVLDVGCGIGWLLSLLPSRIKKGVDPSLGASKNARPGVSVVQGFMKDIGGTFDIVMSWHVLEHVADPPSFIREMASKTRDGGLVFIATPNAGSIFARSDKWRCREPFHRYLVSRRLLRALLREAGLTVEKELTWGGFPAPRPWYKELLNQLCKRAGQGDVQLIIARKKA